MKRLLSILCVVAALAVATSSPAYAQCFGPSMFGGGSSSSYQHSEFQEYYRASRQIVIHHEHVQPPEVYVQPAPVYMPSVNVMPYRPPCGQSYNRPSCNTGGYGPRPVVYNHGGYGGPRPPAYHGGGCGAPRPPAYHGGHGGPGYRPPYGGSHGPRPCGH